ncbi:MAG TPA: glycosyl hydrolase family 65 protein [Chloroflexota bacterium]|nr:glycosyl hydrolase family 65 protein [Chloroflexota bacterium]
MPERFSKVGTAPSPCCSDGEGLEARILALGPWATDLDLAWTIAEDGFDAAREESIESRLAISNGFIGVRGSVEEPTAESNPRTYIAGLYDVLPAARPIEALVPGPGWMRLQVWADGGPIQIDRGEPLNHRRVIDLSRGVLWREWSQRDPHGRIIVVRTGRLVSFADRGLAVQVAEVQPKQPTSLALRAWIELPQWMDLLHAGSNILVWRTQNAGQVLAVAHDARLHAGGQSPAGGRPSRSFAGAWEWQSTEPARFSRFVAFVRGDGLDDASPRALELLRKARRNGIHRVFDEHVRAWSERWAASDVVVEGDLDAQRALRFAIYHLNSAANPDDPRVSVGARALTGEAYWGHVFWDTEIFTGPFYTLTWPEAARAMLMYRYHTLPAARAKAARLGYRGALYAWESASSGDETAPAEVVGPDGRVVPINTGVLEQHISADVAYACWQYWQATEDVPFLLEAGAEIILETARFWVSRAQREPDGRCHIRGVTGPDEYHENVDDSAYTNLMAQWNIERAVDTVKLVEDRWPDAWRPLRKRLGVTQREIDHWREVARDIVTGLDAGGPVVEQFAGYFGLEPVDLAVYSPRSQPLDILLGPERTRRSQVIKQADVVMLEALLRERFTAAQVEAGFDYYEPQCGHGSSLSPAIHALVAARLGRTALALRYFRQAAAIDIDDTMGNAALGIHIGTHGGLWQAAVLGFGGLSMAPDGLRFTPHLPDEWGALAYSVQWRGRRLRVRIAAKPRRITVQLLSGEPMAVGTTGDPTRLAAGETWTGPWGEEPRRGQATGPGKVRRSSRRPALAR